jgi:hypothetical protein
MGVVCMLKAREVYKWLLEQGVPEDMARRALRLASRASIVRIGDDEAIVIVPSQRLGRMVPAHAVSHVDLAALVAGDQPRPRVTVVGELPEDQQFYSVHVRRDGASCQCPLTRLAGAPLCVHRVAAAVLLYEKGRRDLLAWLPKAAMEYRAWRERWLRSRGRSKRKLGMPLDVFGGYN